MSECMQVVLWVQSKWKPLSCVWLFAILKARVLEWVVFPFSRGSSQPRDRTQVSYIAGRFFTSWAAREEEAEWEVTEEGVFLPSFLLSDNFSFQLLFIRLLYN